MSTSSLSGDSPLSADALTTDDANGAAFAGDIARLANQLFAALPAPPQELPWKLAPAAPAAPPTSFIPAHPITQASPFGSAVGAPGVLAPPRIGPSATAVGAGGASPAVNFPPTPGTLQTPPLPSSPLPKEADFRALPTLFSDQVGLPSAFALASPEAVSSEPYYLRLAGLPSARAPAGSQGFAPTSTESRSSFDAPAPSIAPSPPSVGYAPSSSTGSAAPYWAAPELLESGPYYAPASAREQNTRDGRATPDAIEPSPRTRIFDPNTIKKDFPILEERVHGKRLVWLDNAATTQKPRVVIDRLSHFYEHENSNIHRGAHALAARSTDAYEGARDAVRRFLKAPATENVVFVRGTTEAINLVAQSWGRRNVGPGDEIVISWLEHHANIVPWQLLCSEKGAKLRVAPVDDSGQILLDEFEKLLGSRTRLVSFSQVSNALGTVTPAREMVEMAHRYGARVLVDGAQAVSHMPADVQALACDFYCFSGHKVFGPTGIGALYGKSDVLQTMPPWQGGGNMISDVTFEKTSYQPAPARFEAGTGNIADAVALGAALDYLSAIGLENVSRYEHELLVYGTEQLLRVPGLHLIGTARDKAGVLSFVLDGVRTEDVGSALDQEGIAVRSGHHCAQPILRRFGLEASVRASLALYNTCEDIDALVAALFRLQGSRHATQPRVRE